MTPDISVTRSKPLIRVMVVDDSAVVRGLICKYLEADGDIVVAARASNGQVALWELERTQIDLVVLDIEMPVMDGLTALPLLLAAQPGLRVLMASTLTRRNARISLEALKAGAADYVAKPETGSLVNAEAFQRDLLAKVRALGRPRDRASGAGALATLSWSSNKASTSSHIRPQALILGGSTGAPPVLMTIVEALKQGPRQPILIAQHMPPTFTALLADQLGRAAERPAAEAQDGEPIHDGRIYVAPGGRHLLVEKGAGGPVARLSDAPPEHFCRPAVDPLLRSAAAVYGPALAVAILTGMGSDGAEGCRVVADSGGRFVVQDEASSVVWGMPGAAARTGLAEAVLPKGAIADWLRAVAS